MLAAGTSLGPYKILAPLGAGEAYTLPRGPIVQVVGGWLSPAGKHVIVFGSVTGGPVCAWVQELPRGTPRPFGPDEPSSGIRAEGASTPDGRYYAYHYGRSLSDLYVVSGLR